MFGWSYSKVVIPIADFHAPFFSFLFLIVIYGEKKKPINLFGLTDFVLSIGGTYTAT